MNEGNKLEGPSLQTRRKRSAKAIAFGAAIVLVSLVSAFLPNLSALSWHIFHGNSIQFQSWEVPVPWGWRALAQPGFIVLLKVARSDYRSSEVIVTTIRIPPGRTIDPAKLKKAKIENELKSGRHFLSDRETQMDGEKGTCLTFASYGQADDRRVTCDFPTHGLSVGYIGPEENTHYLDQIIVNIRAFR